MGWLAGICLVDAHALALLQRPDLIPIAIGCFVLTRGLHRWIEGT